MTFILTNDDGINAPGIKALLTAFNNVNLPLASSKKSIIVAPQGQLSGCGHQVTTQEPINIQTLSEVEYAIAGTPADCTRIAITHINQNVKWVLSGINSGGNLGVDIYISGTVAAVREAAFHRIPGIALSQYRQGKKPVNWERVTRLAEIVLADLLNRPLEPGAFWNVNFPYLEPEAPDPKMVFCTSSTQPLPVAYRMEGEDFYYTGKYEERDRTPGTDVDVCFAGNIAITKIQL
ncbi:MAG: 5'/3'-nucleotidase SurE [Okeania sp. SIO3C4]|nr:5'/3'-nucleotidase SurE [Okeania sp. SIO3B3]NER06545.1 5'/3'-nucleotidase SurE [Okeania sp. SIO3C4]